MCRQQEFFVDGDAAVLLLLNLSLQLLTKIFTLYVEVSVATAHMVVEIGNVFCTIKFETNLEIVDRDVRWNEDEVLVGFIDHCVFGQGHRLITLPLHSHGQLEISSDIIEILHQRVAQGDPLVEEGVTRFEVNLAEVDLIDSDHGVLEDSF